MPDGDSFLLQLRSQLPGLKPGHQRVLELCLEDPSFVLNANAQQVAARADVSAATVVRAARAAGFTGLPHLRLALARSSAAGEETEAKISRAGSAEEVIDLISASHIRSLQAARSTLDPADIERAGALLTEARRVLLAASGTSLAVAADAAFRLTLNGLTVQHSADSYSAVLLAGQFDAEDVVIAVSHSGETRQTLETVQAAHGSGAQVIAITSFSGSTLAKVADVPLVAMGVSAAQHLVESSSRIAHLGAVDMLCAALTLNGDAQ